ncbi:SMP-30/gluconolactonase/LRE family protein [Achromobacter ruhlandii]|uniref:SMP-30/gluconolactonase/LRE family protein n=1 Tax=Achromobacter ruhlandii TaxID=72557 RepID=UPI003BA1CDF4
MLEPTVDVLNQLGECPIWCDRTNRLFWTDIPGKAMFVYEPESGAVRRWDVPESVGSFALTEAENILLLGMASQLAFFDLHASALEHIAPSPGTSNTRINDGRCDRDGNFVFSTMQEGEPLEQIGAFHRLNAATRQVETLKLPSVLIPNSVSFSPDGGTMYYSDSLQRRIFRCDYPSLENHRVFVEISGPGAPDGSCIDADGFLWNAEWGGSRVVRYRPDGTVDRVLPAPALQTTCPAFGGSDLYTLFCTSARAGLSQPSDTDGALLVVRTAVQGLPESHFARLAASSRAPSRTPT